MTEFSCTVKDCGRRACDPEKCKLYKSDSMSEAKKKYLENPTHYNLLNYAAELEAEKAELIEFISTLQEYDFENIVSEQNRLLKKHGVEI